MKHLRVSSKPAGNRSKHGPAVCIITEPSVCRVMRLPRHARRWLEVAESLSRRRGRVMLARVPEPRRSNPAVVSPSAPRYKQSSILSHPVAPPPRRRCHDHCTRRPHPIRSQLGLTTTSAHTACSWHAVHLSALSLDSSSDGDSPLGPDNGCYHHPLLCPPDKSCVAPSLRQGHDLEHPKCMRLL